MTFNWIDLLLAALIVLSLIGGWRRGFLYEFLDLAGWLASLGIALRWYQPAAHWLAAHARWAQAWNRPAAFLGLFFLTLLLLRLAGGLIAGRLPEHAHRHAGNRLLGLLPGLAHGLINAVVVAALLMALPTPIPVQDATRASELANRFAGYAQTAETALRPVFDDAIDETMNMLTVRPRSSDSVQLPFTVRDTRPRPELEAQMLELVNEERIKAGLRPLAPDPASTEVARGHSTDMLARGYFSHFSPEGKDAFDRMRARRVAFYIAGENLAFAPTLALAHRGLMNSPGHRANILRPQFGRVGIGVMDAGVRGIMVTQNFRN